MASSHFRLEGGGKRILVIDDDLAIRVLLQAVLSRVNFTVDLAEDGLDGLQKLRADKYDLILLDLMMPRVNGYEFLEQRKRESVESPAHVIVFTAAGQRGVDKIPANRICGSILKPFDLESFLQLVGQCINNEHSCPGGDPDAPRQASTAS